jgi:hypothetical protein
VTEAAALFAAAHRLHEEAAALFERVREEQEQSLRIREEWLRLRLAVGRYVRATEASAAEADRVSRQGHYTEEDVQALAAGAREEFAASLALTALAREIGAW